VHTFLYSIGPFVLIACSNFFLIRKILRKKRIVPELTVRIQHDVNGASVAGDTVGAGGINYMVKRVGGSKKGSKMNRTVISMTLIFILMTSPSAMASFFFSTLFSTDYGTFIVNLFNCISFTYHGLNIVIMTVSNVIFRKELGKIFTCGNDNFA
jgi:hypothetical protein